MIYIHTVLHREVAVRTARIDSFGFRYTIVVFSDRYRPEDSEEKGSTGRIVPKTIMDYGRGRKSRMALCSVYRYRRSIEGI